MKNTFKKKMKTFKKVEATSLPSSGRIEKPPLLRSISGRPLADSEDRRAIMLFTSGSSGTPKGVARSFRELNFLLRSYGVPQVAVHYSLQPLSHLSESCVMPSVFMAGGRIAFPSYADAVV